MTNRLISRAARDTSGTAAIEFAIVGQIFLSLAVGMIYVCMLMFSMASMQYAVEEGARCASVKTLVCTSNASTVTHTQNAYFGPVINPTFTSTVAACGHQVTGTANFSLKTGLATINVPLSATSCFP